MKERERFIAALERRPLTGLVPHFELVFFLTMEAFGKLHPSQRQYAQWDQMSRKEQELHLDEIARLYIDTARRYQHSAIFYHGISGWNQETDRRCLERIRELGGDEYALVMHGDATYALPTGDEVLEFSCRMFEDAQGLKDQAERMVDDQIAQAEKIRSWGVLDGFALCSDYCFNTNPFMSPEQFGQGAFARHLGELHELNWDPVHCEKRIFDISRQSEHELERARFMMKIGPMLGLMGTLIPMGPALAGLASGNIESMAYNMQIAFGTTVVGIFVAGVGLLLYSVKRHWFADEIASLQYALDLRLRKEEEHAQSAAA